MLLRTFIISIALVAITWPLALHAQDNQEQSAAYVSQVDLDLTIRRIGIMPVTDNVDGIYARPIQEELIQLIKASHRWDFIETSFTEQVPALVELEENPSLAQKALSSFDADAFVAAAMTRGPNGFSIRIDLFMKKDGKLLSQEILRDYPHFDLNEIKPEVEKLYRKTLARVPYDGIILSRQQNRVTINLGKSDNISKDQIITAVQIISIARHPKFNFIVSSEKEILGRIKILKVDDTLSFGTIISEKERGAIRKFAKVSGLEMVNYPDPAGAGDINGRPDAGVAFGKGATEWLPIRKPSFGEVGMRFGLGGSDENVVTSSGSYEAKASVYPSIAVHGEIWLTSNWTIRADILQAVLSADNPRSGSTPGTLHETFGRYSLEGSYNFLLQDDFFGPKIEVSLGAANIQTNVDSSNPTALTSTSYSGPMLGIGGSFPVSNDKIWYVGGRMNLFAFASLNETPVTSGGSSHNTITEFSAFVQKKIAENIRAVGSIDFSLYNTSFSGSGTRVDGNGNTETASSISQTHTVVFGGVDYMF